MGNGSKKVLIGTAAGAVGGFAVGAFVATPVARSTGQAVILGMDISARFLGRVVLHAVDELGSMLESGYTRIRGREKYLEYQIEELKDQITRLEQRMD